MKRQCSWVVCLRFSTTTLPFGGRGGASHVSLALVNPTYPPVRSSIYHLVDTGFVLGFALGVSEVKNGQTPVVVERIVADIDGIVRLVRFPGWQDTKAGEREVQKALRKVVYVKYQIKDQDLFDKAFGYIRQYY